MYALVILIETELSWDFLKIHLSPDDEKFDAIVNDEIALKFSTIDNSCLKSHIFVGRTRL